MDDLACVPACVSHVSEEEEYYLRMQLLLNSITPMAVRVLFDKEFHPSCLDASIKKESRKLKDLKMKRVINTTQWDLLFPRGGVPNSDTFDVTLMVVLLRNFTNLPEHAGGYDQLPLSSDTTPMADLARIKYFRNQFAHIKDNKIRSEVFTTGWEHICGAVRRLGGQHMYEECTNLRTKHLDQTLVPWNIREQISQILEKWETNNVNFVDTEAAKHVLGCVQKNSCVTITASSGVGKTATLQHVVLKMRKEGYEVLLVTSPHEIVNYCNPNKKTLFAIDDFCGTYSLNQSVLNNWESVLKRVEELIQNKLTKIIVACRLQVFKDGRFDSLSMFRTNVCNLLSEDLCLSQTKRHSIAELYLEKKSSLIFQYSNLYDCFPLLCKLYHDNSELNITDFFKNPFSVYEAEIEQLIKKKVFGKYCALALCVMFNNRLKEEVLTGEINERVRRVINDTCEVCKLDKSTSRLTLLDEFESLEQTFLKKEDGIFRTIHDKIFDFLSYYFGKNIIKCLIKNAHSQFIMERFLLEREEDMDQFITVVPPAYHQLYIQRMIHDWSNGRLMHVFGNRNMDKPKFRNKLLCYLDTFGVPYQKQLARTCDASNRDTVLLQCCFLGDISLIRWCFNHEVDINQCRLKGVSPLYVSSEKGHTEVVKILLDNKAFINECTKDGVSPLYIASQNNHLGIVKLLLDNRADFNKYKNDGASPLFIACQEGYTDIVKLLLNKTADINICRDTGSSPLFIACQNNHSEIVNSLLDNKADINMYKKDGASPLFIACQEGHTDIVKILLNGNADINICPETGLSPIAIAYQNNHVDIVHMFKNIPGGHLKIVSRRKAKIDSKKNVHDSKINIRSNLIVDCIEMEGLSQKATMGIKRRQFSRLKACQNTHGGNKGLLREQIKQKKHSRHNKTWWGLCSPVINFLCYNFCLWFFLYFLPWYCLFMFDL